VRAKCNLESTFWGIKNKHRAELMDDVEQVEKRLLFVREPSVAAAYMM
jgi:hypothetical protein